MIHWIKGMLGTRKENVPDVRPKDIAGRREACTCGRPDHVQPRSSRLTFDQAVDLVLREHGETLRELADR